MKRLLSFLLLGSQAFAQNSAEEKESPAIDAAALYQTYCAACHGVNMEGAQHAPLRKTEWLHGRDRQRMFMSIMYGISNTDMIPWSQVFSEEVFFKTPVVCVILKPDRMASYTWY